MTEFSFLGELTLYNLMKSNVNLNHHSLITIL